MYYSSKIKKKLLLFGLFRPNNNLCLNFFDNASKTFLEVHISKKKKRKEKTSKTD